MAIYIEETALEAISWQCPSVQLSHFFFSSLTLSTMRSSSSRL